MKLHFLSHNYSFKGYFMSVVFIFCVYYCEAPECEWSGDEKKAGGTHRGPTPGPWTAPTQHLLPLLVRLLQVSLVRKSAESDMIQFFSVHK